MFRYRDSLTYCAVEFAHVIGIEKFPDNFASGAPFHDP
jgi:hypothetical protein